MRATHHFTFLFMVVTGCSDPAGGGSSPDALQSVDATVDAAPPTAEPIVPGALGPVHDFAVAGDGLYAILTIDNDYKIVRCPQRECSATPEVIGSATALEIVGDDLFYVVATTAGQEVRQATLDGSGAIPRHQGSPMVTPRLRAANGVVYLSANQTQGLRAEIWAIDAATTGPARRVPNTLSPGIAFHSAFDVADGRLAFWHSNHGSTAPQPIQVIDLATSERLTRGASTKVAPARLSLAADAVFYITPDPASELTRGDLFGCALATGCSTPPSIANTLAATAAHAGRVYFPLREAGGLRIASCSIADAVADTCVPETLVTLEATEWYQMGTIRVVGSTMYVAVSGGPGSLYRIEL